MSAPITISVVITCYNYGGYVGAAIESVLAQTRPADQIVVIDDGSTDDSGAVIAAFGPRITAIFKSNEGYKAAINQGFAVSRGDVVLFLDADDLLYPDALAEVQQAWRGDLAKVQFDLDVIDGTGRRLGRRFANFRRPIPATETALTFRRTGTYRWPVTSGNAHARAFLAQVMPLIPPVGHDGVLNTIAPLYGRVATVGRALGQYRLHGRNMSLTDAGGAHNWHPDFGRQIGFRRQEFDILRQHARARGYALPACDLLDNELVFVNYRLMAQKIGHPYPGQAADKMGRLWGRGIRLALSSHEGLRFKAANCLWLTVLAGVPAFAARALVVLRFNRARALPMLSQWLQRKFGRIRLGGAAS
jgi:glycosyltransferase involved in cell wall biosynthesis